MKESDWNTFKKIKEKAIEIFCRRALDEFDEIIHSDKEHVHNRYLLLFKIVENRNKQMSLIFDGHSRSKARLQLLAMRGEDLVDSELLKELSDKIIEQTDPQRHNW